MSNEIHVPIFSDLAPGGFRHGGNYLVEFAADSLWYETSLTIAARALKEGKKTQYHTFMHIPGEVRQDLLRLVANLEELENGDVFRLIDSYTEMSGLPIQPERGSILRETGLDVPFSKVRDPSYLDKMATSIGNLMAKGASTTDKKWLHIDDNTSIFNRHFKEADVLNIFHSRIFPLSKFLEMSLFHSAVAGVFSEAFYADFEAQCDGVIDFKAVENEGQLESFVRVRFLRGRTCDSKWRRLRLNANGEVRLESPGKDGERGIGISGWLKGPKKK